MTPIEQRPVVRPSIEESGGRPAESQAARHAVSNADAQPLSSAPLRELPPVMSPYATELERLETRLQDGSGVALPALQELLEWVFSSGGKRIRPALVFATASLGDANSEAVTNLAAGIETLHAATLVHDDLIDDALTRRGLPTLNQRWSASATVLAGDWLFARAARFVAETEHVGVVKVFSRTLGALTDGELRQLLGRSGVPTMDEYQNRIYSKTASLFEAATESSGHLLAASDGEIAALAEFGRELGNAFQIIDDILDFTGDEALLGKPVGNDLRSGTVTLPAMLHLTANPGAAPWLEGSETDHTPYQVDELVQAVRGDAAALSASRDAARRSAERAVQALDALAGSPARDSLAGFAEYALDREY
ncbi:MAG: polyprenyl synthetase family protein [Anaerolineae bacterium]